jgi:Uma2 family endonuclease
MADGSQARLWTREEYLAWEEQQERRNEFVAGRIVAMTGARNRHEMIRGDIFFELKRQLRRMGPCEPFGPDTKVAVPNGNIRYPDVVVDCDPERDPNSQFAAKPTVIFEVLSPSNRWLDRERKLADYQQIPECRAIVVVWSTAARLEVLSRDENGAWASVAEVFEGRDAVALLPAVGAELALAEVYGGLSDADLPD